MAARALAAALALASLGALGIAQERPQGCVLQVVSSPGSRSRYTEVAPGVGKLDVGGGLEAICGSAWMRADSASYLQDSDILWLLGAVRYRDTARTLDADRVTYYGREERMIAEGRVTLTARATGSTLKGTLVHYEPRAEGRPYERIFAPRRPHLTVHGDTAAADGEPLEAEGERVTILGDSVVALAGDAKAWRSDFTAVADTMHIDLDTGEIRLFGSPKVTSEGTTLVGDSIRAELRDREIERAEAWPRGRATSESYILAADSIDTRFVERRLRQVIAVRGARGEMHSALARRDSLVPLDWVAGDTIVAHFEPRGPRSNGSQASVPGNPGETQGTEDANVELRELIAFGDARALYHVEDRQRPDRPPAVNYVRGARIRILVAAGEVKEAKVEGPSVGVYIEPQPMGPLVPQDTASRRPGT